MKKLLLSFLIAISAAAVSSAADIAEEWGSVIAPPAPALSEVEAAASDTALLILDIEERTCNNERRPRCMDSVPAIAELMTKARAAGVPVLYSTTGKGSIDSILSPVKPLPGEHVVKASVNKFYGTDLNDELQKRNIKTVIITGTAAHGAVLHTATAASYMGYNVIAPIDCMSAIEPYTEQATVWNLATGPANRKNTTLTKSAMIKFIK